MGRVASSHHPEKSHRDSIRRHGGQVESLIRDQGNSMSEYLSKRIESRVSKRYLYTRVHSSIIHNSQNGSDSNVR